MTLQTVKSKNLQSITISPFYCVPVTVGGAILQERNDLDRLLVQFWFTHSIRPQVMYLVGNGWEDPRDCVPSSLPELTRKGLVDLVKIP